jgi:hypothetical protein
LVMSRLQEPCELHQASHSFARSLLEYTMPQASHAKNLESPITTSSVEGHREVSQLLGAFKWAYIWGLWTWRRCPVSPRRSPGESLKCREQLFSKVCQVNPRTWA